MERSARRPIMPGGGRSSDSTCSAQLGATPHVRHNTVVGCLTAFAASLDWSIPPLGRCHSRTFCRMQDSLFSVSGELITDTTGTLARRRQASPSPHHGDSGPQSFGQSRRTVCVAGLEVGVARTSWIRLYPVNLRHLGEGARFRKYDVIEVEATPATADSRNESWKPDLTTMKVVSRHQKKPWDRRAWVDPMIEPSMCALLSAVAVTDRAVLGLDSSGRHRRLGHRGPSRLESR